MKKHKLAKELSDLVNYCVSTRFQDFQISQQKRTYSINIAASLFDSDQMQKKVDFFFNNIF